MFPDDLLYTQDHEWIRDDSGECVVGITSYASDQLGDVTYVELPEIGAQAGVGETVATVESIKAASDVYSPVSGRVLDVNSSLEKQPELVNKDPYGEGWFFRLDNVDAAGLDNLMNAEAYSVFVEGLDE